MIIGLTGMPASGSDAVGHILVGKGFAWLAYSDILREELERQGKEITRKAMQDLANEIRAEYGGSELSKRLLAKMEQGRHYVVGTIRNPAEVEELRKRGDFILVHVQALQKTRFERIVARGRAGDPQTWDEFLTFEAKESGVGQADTGLRIADCIGLADYTLVNDGTIEVLNERVDEMLMNLNIKL